MSQDQIDALLARLASDPEFAAALAAAPTAQDAQLIAGEHGFDVTPSQLAVVGERELDDAELESVSGGRTDSRSVNHDPVTRACI